MTKGEYRVGTAFNPSKDSLVDRLKRAAADLVDMIEEIPGGEFRDTRSNEVNRLKALAQTNVEEAAMWAVKAATKPHAE